jgi:polysaccharide export outer membrane protein
MKKVRLFSILSLATLPFFLLASGFSQSELGTSLQPGATNNTSARAATRNTTGLTPSTSGRIFPVNGETLIGQGDLIRVEVFGTPEYSQDVRIDTSGVAHLNGIGDITLQDLNLADSATTVRLKLQQFKLMNDPQVTISIQEYISHGISLRGEFKSPGIYPVVGTRHLSDLLSITGGITEFSDGTARIRHGNSPDIETISVWKDADNVWLKPGDEITAVRAGLVYIVGNVARPGGFPLNRPTSIVQALTLAQGLLPSTAENKVQVFRKKPGSDERIDISVRLHDILHGKIADFPLVAEDIVYIPGSPLKAGAKIGATAALAFASQAIVYTISR